ncbi:MAG: hypothetical protein U5L96_16265 [Owenweeksia sp.]|nr:hypothetical protein [Owenweeksia sp.]
MAGRSESTLKNYGHHLAKLALHFGCVPTALDTDQVDDYLLPRQAKAPQRFGFVFQVHHLRAALCVPHGGVERQTPGTAFAEERKEAARGAKPGGGKAHTESP